MGLDPTPLQGRSAPSLRRWLYAICVLSDFAGFIVIFTVSRTLADRHAEPWFLGLIGAGLSFCSGLAAILGGWCASRFDGRVVFLGGALAMLVSAACCGSIDPGSPWFLPAYWLLGLGLGMIYPPLIGWLNQGDTVHENRSGVSRRLIDFCIAWNVGMMTGQFAGGALLERGIHWAMGAALVATIFNLLLAIIAAQKVVPLTSQPILDCSTPQLVWDRANFFKRLGWIANLGGVFGAAIVIHLMPDLMVLIGTPPKYHGMLLACWRGVIISTYLLMHCLTFWHYRLSISLASQIIGATGLIVIAIAQSNLVLLIGLAMLGQLVGFNYFSGLFYSTAGTHQNRRALAAGIHEATLATGMSLGTIAGGFLGSYAGHRAPYGLASAFILFLIFLQIISWKLSNSEFNSINMASGKSDSLPAGTTQTTLDISRDSS